MNAYSQLRPRLIIDWGLFLRRRGRLGVQNQICNIIQQLREHIHKRLSLFFHSKRSCAITYQRLLQFFTVANDNVINFKNGFFQIHRSRIHIKHKTHTRIYPRRITDRDRIGTFSRDFHNFPDRSDRSDPRPDFPINFLCRFGFVY